MLFANIGFIHGIWLQSNSWFSFISNFQLIKWQSNDQMCLKHHLFGLEMIILPKYQTKKNRWWSFLIFIRFNIVHVHFIFQSEINNYSSSNDIYQKNKYKWMKIIVATTKNANRKNGNGTEIQIGFVLYNQMVGSIHSFSQLFLAQFLKISNSNFFFVLVLVVLVVGICIWIFYIYSAW